jgi:hypothetical protein
VDVAFSLLGQFRPVRVQIKRLGPLLSLKDKPIGALVVGVQVLEQPALPERSAAIIPRTAKVAATRLVLFKCRMSVAPRLF